MIFFIIIIINIIEIIIFIGGNQIAVKREITVSVVAAVTVTIFVIPRYADLKPLYPVEIITRGFDIRRALFYGFLKLFPCRGLQIILKIFAGEIFAVRKDAVFAFIEDLPENIRARILGVIPR